MTGTMRIAAIRLAHVDEGLDIYGLLLSTGMGEIKGLSWDDIYPYWLVAEMEGRIVGCLQACPGKPIGRLEFLAVAPDLSHSEKAIVARDLGYAGLETLKAMGCQASSSLVKDDNLSWQRIMERRGAIQFGHGSMYVWGI